MYFMSLLRVFFCSALNLIFVPARDSRGCGIDELTSTAFHNDVPCRGLP